MIFLINHKLPPILQFMCGAKRYTDILYELWSTELTDFDIEEIGDKESRQGFILSSKYYVEPRIFKRWIQRLKTGRLNIEIIDQGEVVFSYFCSKHGVNKRYEIDAINGISIIDYSFVKSRYSSFRSRSKNAVSMSGQHIKKSSSDVEKIIAEYSFMEKYSRKFDFYTPVFGLEQHDGGASYHMPLVIPGDVSSYYLESDLHFFNESGFRKFCIRYFRETLLMPEPPLQDNGRKKCEFSEELRQRMHSRHEEFNESISELIIQGEIIARYTATLHDEIMERLDNLFVSGEFSFVNESPLGVLHGDFCLSNILYDAALKQFFLIDPRGDETLPVCMDLAKLAHSLHGGYDLILAGRYSINLTISGLRLDLDVEETFSDIFFEVNNYLELHPPEKIVLLEVYLFLTMIKFHREDLIRCLAFLLRARDLLSDLSSGALPSNVS